MTEDISAPTSAPSISTGNSSADGGKHEVSRLTEDRVYRALRLAEKHLGPAEEYAYKIGNKTTGDALEDLRVHLDKVLRLHLTTYATED